MSSDISFLIPRVGIKEMSLIMLTSSALEITNQSGWKLVLSEIKFPLLLVMAFNFEFLLFKL